MLIHAFQVFGTRPGSGNPALVIEHDGLDAAGRQQFARERGLTCVFLDAAAGTVDYWYPHTRSPLCVHATLAAARVLLSRHGSGPMAVTTTLGGQRLELMRCENDFYVAMEQHLAPAIDIAETELAALLRSTGLPVTGSPRVASVGSPKLLVEVADTDVLYGLAPDLPAIVAWARAHGVNGLYVYCRTGDHHYEGRNFNHLEPHLEDSATGVAAGALTALLGHDLMLRQGRATGRDCLIRTRGDGASILVGGAVEPG